MSLTFTQLAQANLSRVNRWHKAGLDQWSPNDWMTALIGELGEAANIMKKLKRLEDELPNVSDRNVLTQTEAIEQIGNELADTMIYLDLLAQRLGINLEIAVVHKFNVVSDRYGFPEKL